MKVVVDREICEANAICAGLSPKVFEVDDEDQIHILVEAVPPEEEAKVREAVLRCPKQALSLVDET